MCFSRSMVGITQAWNLNSSSRICIQLRYKDNALALFGCLGLGCSVIRAYVSPITVCLANFIKLNWLHRPMNSISLGSRVRSDFFIKKWKKWLKFRRQMWNNSVFFFSFSLLPNDEFHLEIKWDFIFLIFGLAKRTLIGCSKEQKNRRLTCKSAYPNPWPVSL